MKVDARTRAVRWLMRQPATHKIRVKGATITECSRVYRPDQTPIRGTTDDARVTCRNCLKRMKAAAKLEPKVVS